MLIAEVNRHLRLDPCLPDGLLPSNWPAETLRTRHAAYVGSYARRLRESGEA